MIATAGHVDHGKSTLLRALTGMEPDRWAEEHRRGMTIDLGYVWTSLPTGETVAFVDVPGHQRFISNTLAGLGPVPAVLLVVAADEGWCRQTGEHVAALQALGVCHGILVITRADLGDADLAAEEAREYLRGTTLDGIEPVAVSAVTGMGLDDLRAALSRLLSRLPAPRATPAARLWVDRVFTVRGAGTVLTGTLSSGRITTGDELLLAPSDRLVRVRKLESLKQSLHQVTAVSRVAVNVRGLSADEVHRGHALVSPSLWTAASTLDVRLLTPAEKMPTQAILHIGSAATTVHIRMFGADTARLSLSGPLPLHVGERALLRDPGEQRILAGLIILDTEPPSLRRHGGKTRAKQLADMSGGADPEGEVARRRVISRGQLVAMGVSLPDAPAPDHAVPAGDWLIHQDQWTEWLTKLNATVEQWAAAHPMTPGISRNAVTRSLGLPDQRLLDALLAEETGLVSDADGVHCQGVSAALPEPVATALGVLGARLAANPFAAPGADELISLGLTSRHLATAVKRGLLIHVGDGVYLPPDAPDLAMLRMSALQQPFTLSDARQALRTTRRVAIPLLEWLDRTGRTRRIDSDRRSVQTDVRPS
ncbi:selenocysteine-specific translation elongation factor [Streptacidiphilus carbonis]|uniref:selenocysteine-specific translation elongation factor n=1 Tax=Streptacidiphilus carbonis TaxID=105422 RepID=UPI00191C648E|nr:selenocysteine-specific translation elongation factor [Streptacidiphilus carbonis]